MNARSPWPMYRAMVGTGLLCGVLIVTVFELTRPTIARNQAEALRRAILEVLPGARSSRTFRFVPSDGFEALTEGAGDGARAVHPGYDAEGHLVGVAVEARGMGYQDEIRVIYGYSPAADAIVGFHVLESRETPGLGDRIQTDPGFLANFAHLDVSLTPDLTRVVHPIELVKHGEKHEAWQVDGITGATISSTAVADLLRRSTVQWIPRIRQHLADFEEAR